MNAMNATKSSKIRFGTALALGCALASPVSAGLSADQIARLGVDLTPLGGERAGNADGTIPEWTGGITGPPAGYAHGEHHRDLYAGDEPRFVIDASNLEEHRDRLSIGHQRMLETYPSFKMQVYPTRRSASVAQRIYDATREVAATAKLVDDGNGVADAVIGIPFPIPKNGLEVVWNHLLRYRGESVSCVIGQAAVTRGGAYTLVKQHLETELRYSLPGMTLEELGNTMILFKSTTLAPARLAGDIVLVHETMNQFREPRNAWTYNPGQRRVRRAPNIAYDNPGTSSDGLRTADQLDMFNGAVDRYDWKLVGKREMYVPYNSYRLHSDDAQVHRHPQAPACQPGRTCATNCTGSGWWRRRSRKVRDPPLQAAHLLCRRGFLVRSWLRISMTTGTSSGAMSEASPDQLLRECRWCGRPWKCIPTCRPGATSHSVSTTSLRCAPGTPTWSPGTSPRPPCAARAGDDAGPGRLIPRSRRPRPERLHFDGIGGLLRPASSPYS